MSNRLTKRTITLFESIKHVDESGNEYWTSRAMWRILGYTEYRHFLPVIEKAKVACQNSSQRIEDHFEDVLEMVGIGSGAERPVDSVKFSRYACYLIVQNADPSKAIVAQGKLTSPFRPVSPRFSKWQNTKNCQAKRKSDYSYEQKC